jgi:hypothetical protein
VDVWNHHLTESGEFENFHHIIRSGDNGRYILLHVHKILRDKHTFLFVMIAQAPILSPSKLPGSSLTFASGLARHMKL